jgi:hypothetical protein
MWRRYRDVRVRVALLVCGALVGLLAFASSGSAAVTQLGSLTADSPIAASDGWVVWSAQSPDGWQLTAWHAGVVTTLPVATRPEPFDVSLGTDAQGRMVATYSRCAVTPSDSYGDTVPAWSGRDCRVYVLELASGQEHAAPIPHPAGVSDTFPSMWRGRIAFARYEPAHPDAAQIELWTPGSSTLRTLPAGPMPTRCPITTGCAGQPRVGAVDGLSLNGQLVSFRWFVIVPAVRGHSGWEIRADRLSDGQSMLAGSGFDGEVCEGGIDTIEPYVPVNTGHRVLFGQSTDNCYAQTVELLDFDTLTQRTLGARLTVSGQIIEMTSNGDSLFALVAPQPTRYTAPTCSTPGAPCLLEQITIPTLDRPVGPAITPFPVPVPVG